MKEFRFLFGPVLSRRLGVSLGIDLLPYKTCSFDCVYCECGETTNLTLKRETYFPVSQVKEELRRYLGDHPPLDYITFSGSGEPTLYKGLGEVISFLKKEYGDYKIALLTNSTLLTDQEVREEVRELDLIVPSLDSATDEGIGLIDKPPGGVKVHEIIEGIKKTRDIISGEMWLEVFIVPGINDTPLELNRLRSALDYINPHKIQVNSLDRRGTKDWVTPLDEHTREVIYSILKADVLHIKDERFRIRNGKHYLPFNTMKGQIMGLLKEESRNVKDLCNILEISEGDLNRILSALLGQNIIVYDTDSLKYRLNLWKK